MSTYTFADVLEAERALTEEIADVGGWGDLLTRYGVPASEHAELIAFVNECVKVGVHVQINVMGGGSKLNLNQFGAAMWSDGFATALKMCHDKEEHDA